MEKTVFKIPPRRVESCKTCRFVDTITTPDKRIVNICRAGHPRPIGGPVLINGNQLAFQSQTHWSIIDLDIDWCGDFESSEAVN